MIFPCLFPFAASPAAAMEGTGFDFRGSLESRFRVFPQDALDPDQGSGQHAYGIEAELNLGLPHGLEARAHPRLRLDGNRIRQNPLVMDDFYLGQFIEGLQWRAGYQVFSWKVVESYSQADVLNQTDRRLDLLDPDKLAEPAAFLRLDLPAWLGEALEAYSLPYFTPGPLPRSESRYSPVTGTPFTLVSDADSATYDSPSGRWEPQWALRHLWRPGSFDVAFFWFHGYRRFPVFAPHPAAPGTLVPRYLRVEQGGMTFQGTLGNWILKGEGSWQGFTGDVRGPTGSPVDPYGSFTTGFEYTFYAPIAADQDVVTLVEWIGDTDSGKDPIDLEGFRPFQNDLFMGLRYVFNGLSDATATGGVFWDYREGDALYKLELRRRFFTHLSCSAGYNGVMLGSDTGRFQFLDRSSNLFADLKAYW
ncbi:MAG TPA: hypothetical protein VJ385_03610 [Fibrobacteria bacterium]|nr:hypothetical protein [Fibrobacteria bacterium]